MGKGRNVQLPKRESKYAMYESVPAVRRWLTNLARGSPITAEVALSMHASEDDAKILEDVLIAVHHPFYNTPLRRMHHH